MSPRTQILLSLVRRKAPEEQLTVRAYVLLIWVPDKQELQSLLERIVVWKRRLQSIIGALMAQLGSGLSYDKRNPS
jgi:hypothetical protein